MVDDTISTDDLWELAKSLIGSEISKLSEEIFSLEQRGQDSSELRKTKCALVWERDDLMASDRNVLFRVVEKYGKK